eukprot:365187-Chlamydomonas_euryale.AAC.4
MRHWLARVRVVAGRCDATCSDASRERALSPLADRICQREPVRRNSLFTAKTTYADKTTGDAMFGAIPASVMDFDVDASGVITGIKVSEVACVGYRDFATCTLPRLWDVKQGRGPWMPWMT